MGRHGVDCGRGRQQEGSVALRAMRTWRLGRASWRSRPREAAAAPSLGRAMSSRPSGERAPTPCCRPCGPPASDNSVREGVAHKLRGGEKELGVACREDVQSLLGAVVVAAERLELVLGELKLLRKEGRRWTALRVRYCFYVCTPKPVSSIFKSSGKKLSTRRQA
eukprot:3669596-Pleurochrysis_carterae.AAC.3